MRIAGLIGLLLLTACTSIPLFTPTVSLSSTPGNPLRQPQKIEFEAEDHTKLAGYYYPAAIQNAPVIVLMHVVGGSHTDWEEVGLVQWLLNNRIDNPHPNFYPPLPEGRSFAVFSIDFRGHGASEGYTIFPNFILDAKATYEQAAKLTGVDPTRIAGIGASIGADAVVDACQTCLGALTLSPGSYISSTDLAFQDEVDRLDAQDIIVWCLAGKKDQQSADTCANVHGKHYKSFLYDGIYHGTGILSVKNAPEGVGQIVYDWLMEAFK